MNFYSVIILNAQIGHAISFSFLLLKLRVSNLTTKKIFFNSFDGPFDIFKSINIINFFYFIKFFKVDNSFINSLN